MCTRRNTEIKIIKPSNQRVTLNQYTKGQSRFIEPQYTDIILDHQSQTLTLAFNRGRSYIDLQQDLQRQQKQGTRHQFVHPGLQQAHSHQPTLRLRVYLSGLSPLAIPHARVPATRPFIASTYQGTYTAQPYNNPSTQLGRTAHATSLHANRCLTGY